MLGKALKTQRRRGRQGRHCPAEIQIADVYRGTRSQWSDVEVKMMDRGAGIRRFQPSHQTRPMHGQCIRAEERRLVSRYQSPKRACHCRRLHQLDPGLLLRRRREQRCRAMASADVQWPTAQARAPTRPNLKIDDPVVIHLAVTTWQAAAMFKG